MTAEARLRAVLDAAATADPVPPAWEDIRARSESGEVLPALPTRRPRALLAAAVVVAALIVGGGLAARSGGEADTASSSDSDYCAVLARPAFAGVGVVVHLEPDVDPGTVDAVGAAIDATGVARAVVYRDRTESFATARELFADEPTMVEILRPEDVPTSFLIEVGDAPDADRVAAAVEGRAGVLDVDDDRRLSADVDLYAEVAALARGGSGGLTGRAVDPQVLDAFAAAAPEVLVDDVRAVRDALAEPIPRDTPGPAVGAVLADAGDRCGRTPPADPHGDPPTTAASAGSAPASAGSAPTTAGSAPTTTTG
ncbi:MAG TPA: permease-like cell division protein FtsX [Iamia sp.]|nr:permease-like cell division protein FtsX [Iamia sp.]